MPKYRDINTGEILTEEQFNGLQETPEEKALTFGERFKAGFGSPEVREQLKQREAEAGLRGKLDIGDIADIAVKLFHWQLALPEVLLVDYRGLP